MDVLFVSTELAPFVKAGGLADVTAALPKALRALGHKVTLLLPRYSELEEAGLLLARRLTPLKLTLGTTTYEATVFDGRLASQVDLVLVDFSGDFFSRKGIYGAGGADFPDNAQRFAAFSRAAAEIVRQRALHGTPFDIVHLNDWPTALVSTYLDELKESGTGTPKTVLTIHNVAHQGIFPKETLPSMGFGWDRFQLGGFEFYGKVNTLKQGILSADAVATVSTTYAREIQTAAGGFGLDGVLRARGDKLLGITNGVDYSVWNPATDPALAARFDAEDPSAKARCKGALLRELGLPIELDRPLVASVGRLVPQKGIDLLIEALPHLLRGTDAQFVVAGAGEKGFEAALKELAGSSGGRVAFVGTAPEAQVHRIFGAADLALVPSRYEPCGLTQLYAQRYGAAPVARSTGGLKDTVVDADAQLETGNGFLFVDPTADDLVGALERAIAAYRHARWPVMVRRIMRTDRAWDRAARRYDQLYRSLTG